MGQSCGVRSHNKDDEQDERLIEVKCTEQHQKGPSEYLVEQEKKNRLIELVTEENGNEDDIQEIKNILETNKTFLTDRYRRDNKISSILRIAKYSSKSGIKQNIVQTIIDVGYRLFPYSDNLSIIDKCHSFFFVAAKGDLKQLEEIVTYFRNNNLTKIHDTCEGDTILSFMAKFGNYFEQDFLKCFKFMLEQGIDIKRTDYRNRNLKQIIINEISFAKSGISDKLKTIYYYVEIFAQQINDVESKINHKYKLFQTIIQGGKTLKNVTDDYKQLVNSDDGENTLLQLAIIKNNVDIANELLHMGANPNLVVEGRNIEAPLVLAGMLNKNQIFKEISKNKNTEITKKIFVKFVRRSKWNFLNPLLESKNLNVNFEHNGNVPLYYAITARNKKAIKSLLERGSSVNETSLQKINPKDLENYLNSCIKLDYQKDMEENNYKSFLVFDFFINAYRKYPEKKKPSENFNENERHNNGGISTCFESEVEVIRNIGNIKRLRYLLEHPLVYIYIMLKWHCVKKYYYFSVIVTFIFYFLINILIITGLFNSYIANRVLLIQCVVIIYNCRALRRNTSHFILDILILLCLTVICGLKLLNGITVAEINQVSAFIIIFTSLSLLLTIGYHLKLSKWTAMATRVFKNFSILLIFFMIPITAFAMSFTLLLSVNEEASNSGNDTTDFSSFPRALSRTLIMIGGDIGDKRFTGIGSYLLFLVFTIGIAIILLNFWTGVAVSDIKEIEEQSTIVAFKNVIVFIENTEIMYRSIFYIILKTCLPMMLKCIQVPFLKSKIYLKQNKKFCFGIDFYINSQKHFDKDTYFENCRIPHDIISKIKTLSDVKQDETKLLENIMTKLSKLEQLLQDKNTTNK